MKTLVLWIFLLLFPSLVCAAVAHDNADAIAALAVDTLTISGFAVATSNPFIVCSVAETAEQFVDVTFNGVSFDVINQQVVDGRQMTLVGKTGLSGTHDVVATMSDLTNVAFGCASFTGVDQSTPYGTVQTGTDFVSVPISITVPANGLGFNAIGDINGGSACASFSADGGQTLRYEACDFTESVARATAGATQTASGDAPWSGYLGGYSFQIGIPINPAATISPVRHRRAVLQ